MAGQFVADAPHRGEVARLRRVVLYLLADLADHDGDGVGVGRLFTPPQRLEELAAREHAARVRREHFQKPKLTPNLTF